MDASEHHQAIWNSSIGILAAAAGRDVILRALEQANWNISSAARTLNGAHQPPQPHQAAGAGAGVGARRAGRVGRGACAVRF